MDSSPLTYQKTLDMEVMVHTLKGIHTFRRDCNTQASMCSPWVMWIRPFLSLRKKMKEYIEERNNILNPFASNREFPNRAVPLPFAKENPQTTKTKRRCMERRCDIKKLRKGDKGFYPVPRVSQSHGSRDCAPQFHTYPACTGSNTNSTSSHHRHLCTASYSNSTYPASGNHLQTVPTFPKILFPLYAH